MFVRCLAYSCVVSDKRAKNLQNGGALRRRSRRVEDEQQTTEAPSRNPAAIILPDGTSEDGTPSSIIQNLLIHGFPRGVVVPKGGYAVAERLEISGCDTGVENEGQLDASILVIE
jgi:hypothetical protein